MQRSQQLYGRFRKNLKDKLVYHNSYERARLMRMKKMENDLDRLCLLELRCLDLDCTNNVNVLRTEEHLFRKLKKARVDRWVEERVGQHYALAASGGFADHEAAADCCSGRASPQTHPAPAPAPHQSRLHLQLREHLSPRPAGTSQRLQQQSERLDQKRRAALSEQTRTPAGDVEDSQAAAMTSVAPDTSSPRQIGTPNAGDSDLPPSTLRRAAASRSPQPPPRPMSDGSVSGGGDRLPPLMRQERRDRDGRFLRSPPHLHRPQLHRSVVYSKYWGRLVYSSEDRGALFQDVRRQRLRMLDAEREELAHFVVAFARKVAAGDGGNNGVVPASSSRAPLAPRA